MVSPLLKPIKTPSERGLTASTELRFVTRPVVTVPGGQPTGMYINGAPILTAATGTTKTFLQQRWFGPREDEWHDVPTVEVKP